MGKVKLTNSYRSYNWEIIVYKEHFADNLDLYVEIQELKTPALLSPLHDKDKYTSGEKKGELKPAHWHLDLMFEKQKTFKQICELATRFYSIPENIAPILSLPGAVHYLTHDGYEIPNFKPRYEASEVEEFGGADYKYLFQQIRKNKFSILLELCKNNQFDSIAQLYQFLLDVPDFEYLLEEAGKKAFPLKQYIEGLQSEKRKEKKSGKENII